MSVAPDDGVRSNRWSRDAVRCVRRAGMERLCSSTFGSRRAIVALVDGMPVLDHPALRDTPVEIVRIHSSSVSRVTEAADAHATFIASMFVGVKFGSLGLCPACPLVAIAAVDESILAPQSRPLDAALHIVRGLLEALQRGAHIIQVSLEFGFGTSPAARLIADAITACVARGSAIVLASGGGSLRLSNDLLWMPGVVPVCAADEAGEVLCDERWGAMMVLRGMAAPGTRIPGAALPDRIELLAGSSYAASFVTATLALLMSNMPGITALEAVSVLRQPRSIGVSVGHPMYLDADLSLDRLKSMRGVLYDQQTP